ncbi:hypothetical protein LCGC14_0311300 [marine sediment metagenome]|uniref:Uncharacterized protein n=1 Tax=marine sediment metagenome TaxID=412755 RepID=A0A0F9U4X2_9ZZZZ
MRCPKCKNPCTESDLVPDIAYDKSGAFNVVKDEDDQIVEADYYIRERRGSICRVCIDEMRGRLRPRHMREGRRL